MRGAILFLPSGVAGAMCYWQLQRMQWKVRTCRHCLAGFARGGLQFQLIYSCSR
jgi:hypothetical protein